MSLPTSERLTDAAATLNKFGHAGKHLDTDPPSKADRLLRDVLELIRRAQAGDVIWDGMPTNTGYDSVRSSDDPERLTPLEAHMDRLIEAQREEKRTGKPAPTKDKVYDTAELAAGHLLEAAFHLKAAQHAVELAASKTTPHKGPGQEQAECKQIHCHDNAAPGRKGNCEACYRWLYDHNIGRQPGDEVAAVDKDTIDRRVEERRTGKAKRRHENGPYADAS